MVIFVLLTYRWTTELSVLLMSLCSFSLLLRSNALVLLLSVSLSLSHTQALFCRRSTVLLTADMSELSYSEGHDTPSKPQIHSAVSARQIKHFASPHIALCLLLNASSEHITKATADRLLTVNMYVQWQEEVFLRRMR